MRRRLSIDLHRPDEAGTRPGALQEGADVWAETVPEADDRVCKVQCVSDDKICHRESSGAQVIPIRERLLDSLMGMGPSIKKGTVPSGLMSRNCL
jgi:hypothetical protein